MGGAFYLGAAEFDPLPAVSPLFHLPADELLDWSGKAGLKIQHFRPKRCDLDPRHLLVHCAHLGLESVPLLGGNCFSRRGQVFGRHSFDQVDGGSAAHEQNMGRESVGINR